MKNWAYITQPDNVSMKSSGNGNGPLGLVTGFANNINKDDQSLLSDLITENRETKRSQSLNDEVNALKTVDNLKAHRRTSSESYDCINKEQNTEHMYNHVSLPSHHKIHETLHESSNNSDFPINGVILRKVAWTNIGNSYENRLRDDVDAEQVRPTNNAITWKSSSPKHAIKAASELSTPESSDSNTVIEIRLPNMKNEYRKMSFDDTPNSSQSSSCILNHNSTKHSIASSEDALNNSYFYDEDFQVKFDSNIRDRCTLDCDEADSILEYSDDFCDDLTLKRQANCEDSLSLLVRESISDLNCSTEALKINNETVFTPSPLYEGPPHTFSTDSLDHDRFLTNSQYDSSSLDCHPKKENYKLLFSGYSDKRGSSDASIDSEDALRSTCDKYYDPRYHAPSPLTFDSPQTDSSNTSIETEEQMQKALINKWATRNNLISPSGCLATHPYTKTSEKCNSTPSLTCWTNIKRSNQLHSDSVPKSVSYEEFGTSSSSSNSIKTSAHRPGSSLLNIYRHSRCDLGLDSSLNSSNGVAEYHSLPEQTTGMNLSESNEILQHPIRTVQCSSLPSSGSHAFFRETRQHTLSAPAVCLKHNCTDSRISAAESSNHIHHVNSCKQQTKECAVQTSLHRSRCDIEYDKRPPRSRSCPQDMSAEFDDFIREHLMDEYTSREQWLPGNAESMYGAAFGHLPDSHPQKPFKPRKRRVSLSPMRPVKSLFYSHQCHKSLPDLAFLDSSSTGKATAKRLNNEGDNKITKIKTHSSNCTSKKHESKSSLPYIQPSHTLQTRSRSTGSLCDKMNIRGPVPPKSINTTRNLSKYRMQEMTSSSGASSSSSGIDPGYCECVSHMKNLMMQCYQNHHVISKQHHPHHMICCNFESHQPDIGLIKGNRHRFSFPDQDNARCLADPKLRHFTLCRESASLGDLYALNEEMTPTSPCKDFYSDFGSSSFGDKDAYEVLYMKQNIDNFDKPLKSCLRKENGDEQIMRRCCSLSGTLTDDNEKIASHNSQPFALCESSGRNTKQVFGKTYGEMPMQRMSFSDQTYTEECPDDLAGSKFTLSTSGDGTDDVDRKEKRKSVSFASDISFQHLSGLPDAKHQLYDSTSRDAQNKSSIRQSTDYGCQVVMDQCFDSPPSMFKTSSSTIIGSYNLEQKASFINDINKATKALIAHFSKGRQPHHKLQLGNLSESPELGHIVLSQLCPAVARIISDGLRSFLSGIHILGRVHLTIWRVVEYSVELGDMGSSVSDLLVELRNKADLMTTRQKFEAFVFGLLNLRMLDSWLCMIRGKEALMLQLYEPMSLLSATHDSLREEFSDMIMTLQLLTVLPFQLDLSFVVSYHTSKLSKDVDDLYLDHKFGKPTSRNITSVTKTEPHDTFAGWTCPKNWWTKNSTDPDSKSLLSTVRKHIPSSWSFSRPFSAMSQSSPASTLNRLMLEIEAMTEGSIRRLNLSSNRRNHQGEKVSDSDYKVPGKQDEAADFVSTPNNDKKTPPAKPKRLSKTERDLMQSMEEFNQIGCNSGENMSDSVFGSETSKDKDYVYMNIPPKRLPDTTEQNKERDRQSEKASALHETKEKTFKADLQTMSKAPTQLSNTIENKCVEITKISKIPIKSPVKQTTRNCVVATKPPISKMAKNSKITPTKGKNKSNTGEKSKLIKIFDKILIPEKSTPVKSAENRWSWGGTPCDFVSRIPTLKHESPKLGSVKNVHKSQPRKINSENSLSEIATSKKVQHQLSIKLTECPSENLDVSLCDLSTLRPSSCNVKDISSTQPNPHISGHKVKALDGNANFLDPLLSPVVETHE